MKAAKGHPPEVSRHQHCLTKSIDIISNQGGQRCYRPKEKYKTSDKDYIKQRATTQPTDTNIIQLQEPAKEPRGGMTVEADNLEEAGMADHQHPKYKATI